MNFPGPTKSFAPAPQRLVAMHFATLPRNLSQRFRGPGYAQALPVVLESDSLEGAGTAHVKETWVHA